MKNTMPWVYFLGNYFATEVYSLKIYLPTGKEGIPTSQLGGKPAFDASQATLGQNCTNDVNKKRRPLEAPYFANTQSNMTI